MHPFKKHDVDWTHVHESITELEEHVRGRNIIGALACLHVTRLDTKIREMKRHVSIKNPAGNQAIDAFWMLIDKVALMTRIFINDLVQSSEASINRLDFAKATRIMGLLECLADLVPIIGFGPGKVREYITNARAWMEWAKHDMACKLYSQLDFLMRVIGVDPRVLQQRIYELESVAKHLGLMKEHEDDIHVILK